MNLRGPARAGAHSSSRHDVQRERCSRWMLLVPRAHVSKSKQAGADRAGPPDFEHVRNAQQHAATLQGQGPHTSGRDMIQLAVLASNPQQAHQQTSLLSHQLIASQRIQALLMGGVDASAMWSCAQPCSACLRHTSAAPGCRLASMKARLLGGGRNS